MVITTPISQQTHCCLTCGLGRVGPGKCADCYGACMPEWNVIDERGHKRGRVYGGSEAEALESAKQSMEFDALPAFTVREAFGV